MIWPAPVFTGFGLLFVSKDPALRGLTLGPVLLLLVGIAGLAWRSARFSGEGAGPSPGETEAWNAAQLLLAAVIFLQMIAAGRLGEGWITWCLLFGYASLVLLGPEIRARRLGAQARHRGVVEDERDATIQAAATRWSKRTLETSIVAGAAVYALYASRMGDVPDARATVAAVFAVMFVANAIGQWRAAMLYWRDRR
ncbi:hypothetical protein [Luteimonas sp. 3794]|uniref:hypothetical protein n=1 Tax=Luteimonas sp. 3794 TaxID=2817730 RepID=UPI002867AFA3|nr:hypothetical protein [Luteimonas sp. 3794]MDR6992030.1 putative membrane protein [Luteimonas sp. 3794]